MDSSIQEIRREKVFIPQNLSVKEIQEKYNISNSSACTTKKRGWFIKNYARNQVIIDRENFEPIAIKNKKMKVLNRNIFERIVYIFPSFCFMK
jgi:hypothetical protein